MRSDREMLKPDYVSNTGFMGIFDINTPKKPQEIVTETRNMDSSDNAQQKAKFERKTNALVLTELSKLGIDTNAAKDFAKFRFKTNVITGYILSVSAIIFGSLFLIVAVISLIQSEATFWEFIFTLGFMGVFVAGGVNGLIDTYKMSRLIKKEHK